MRLEFSRDLRYAARSFRRAPAFTLAAALTLAIGIGATTTVFSVIDGVLVRGLPYRDADRIVDMWEVSDNGGYRLPSYPTFKDWIAANSSWRGVFDEMAFLKGDEAIYVSDKGPERLIAASVSPGFFHLLGTPPLLGRTFIADEERVGANRVAVLSYELWRQRFGGDPSIVGRKVPFSGFPTTVIGVMPRGFTYPAWASLWQPIAAVETTNPALARRDVHSDSRTIGRLRDGADSVAVATAMRPVEQHLAEVYPAEQGHWMTAVTLPLRDEILGSVRPMLLTIGGAVLLILLLACANVANLLLVRGSSRERELGVRAALGADRFRLVRQLLAESLTIALTGGLLGAGLATLAVRLIRQNAASELPRANQIVVEPRTLLFAAGVTVVAAVLAGVAPALRATRSENLAALRSGAFGAVGARRDVRLRAMLVVAQLALALVLLVGSTLLLESFRRLGAVDLGFSPQNRVAIGVFPPAGKYDNALAAEGLYRQLMARMQSVPGVRDVALVNHLPIGGGWVTSPVGVDGGAQEVTKQRQALYRTVSASYLRTMGMQIARGRWFTDADIRERTGVVINETLAREEWGDANPLGRHITLRRSSQQRPDYGQPISVIVTGVIKDVRQQSLADKPSPEVFVPWTLEVWPWVTLVAHVQNPSRDVPLLRRAILDVDPAIPVAGDDLQGGFVRLDELLGNSIAQRKLATSLVGSFALVALILAAVGMYGVMAYGVAQRTREMGVRIALGASRIGILRLVVGESARLAVAGVVIGLAGAVAATRLIRSLLFETTPTDATTLASASLVLVAVTLVAAYVPALRATRVDPIRAMRAD